MTNRSDNRIRKNIYFEPGVLKAVEQLRAETGTSISFTLWMNLVAKTFVHDEKKFRRYTHGPRID